MAGKSVPVLLYKLDELFLFAIVGDERNAHINPLLFVCDAFDIWPEFAYPLRQTSVSLMLRLRIGGFPLPFVIEIENVHWHRGEDWILNNIDWSVRSGEHWALLGLNGSGKTTLLNMITGYIWPTEGRVSVLGHRFGTVDLRELRKRIGWVSSSFQERIHPRENALEVVLSGLCASIGLYEEPDAASVEKALELMASLGCRHTAHRAYTTCSHGEKQKLLIARALMAEPDLLILDKPCTGLDFVARESLLNDIAELARRDRKRVV